MVVYYVENIEIIFGIKKMKILAKETILATWKCPVCESENTEFLVEGQSLSKELQCSFCNHESGLIEWYS